MVELQQQRTQETEKNMHMERDNDDDYLQVLDAGEHMYGMFVGENEDLYAYLRSNDEQDYNEYNEYECGNGNGYGYESYNNEYNYNYNYNHHESSESIDEVLSRSVDGIFLCGADVFEQGTSNDTCCNDINCSEDDRSATAGRVTPTKGIEEGHHDDDAIIE